MGHNLARKTRPQFNRKRMRLSNSQTSNRERAALHPPEVPSSDASAPNVLVVNASHEMAKEITMQLSLSIPNCSIIYAPSIELAELTLKRRKISLIVASALLPDGNVSKLKNSLNLLQSPPDLVVVGDMNLNAAEGFETSGYEFAGVKRLGKQDAPESKNPISNLGADIRNDLNNPLQEIVAMVFVAQASGELSEATEQSLQAIDKAAKNMAEVVWNIEDKLKNAIT